MTESRRWDGLSLLKLICCVIVVLLHCPLPGMPGDAVVYGLRFSVPCFFMISGYFAWDRNAAWAGRRALRTAGTVFLLEALYGLWALVQHTLLGVPDLSGPLTAGGVVQRVLCGTFFNGTLWYLYALAYGWGVWWLLARRGLLRRACRAIVPLLAWQIAGRYILQGQVPIGRYVWLFRNVTFALPFLLLGGWVRAHEARLTALLPLGRCVLLAAAGGALICAEYVGYGQYMDLHVSTVIIAVALVVGAAQVAVLPGRVGRLLAFSGRRLTGGAYYAHAFVASLAELSALNAWAAPFAVIAGSFALALAGEGVQRWLTGRRHR